MKGWTQADIDRLQKKTSGKDPGPGPLPASSRQRVKLPKYESPEKREFMAAVMLYCRAMKLPLFAEQMFSVERLWRFDLLIPGIPVALEYEGLMSDKSGHTTIKGYTDNCDKYNQATIAGIRVIRYTAKNWQKVLPDLEKIYNHG